MKLKRGDNSFMANDIGEVLGVMVDINRHSNNLAQVKHSSLLKCRDKSPGLLGIPVVFSMLGDPYRKATFNFYPAAHKDMNITVFYTSKVRKL